MASNNVAWVLYRGHVVKLCVEGVWMRMLCVEEEDVERGTDEFSLLI